MLLRKNLAQSISVFLIAFAAGAMLGAVFFNLLPEAAAELPYGLNFRSLGMLFNFVLLGMILFFITEKLLLWWHHHEETMGEHHYQRHLHPHYKMIILGDALHNAIDGVVIALSFLVSFPAGVATSLAIIFHELPQEIGDFGVLIHAKLSRGKVFLYNFLAGLTTPAGALLAYLFRDYLQPLLPILLAIAAGSFIYIAASDLIPEIHRHHQLRRSLLQILAMLLGIFMIWLVS